ncbi:putative (di)nucleoside polyphosphate hydrolase [Cricetibacter osteomyelitidis]|uniref:RNA pyrophosphohydrolase n=1 Tax=Cricetibacter osteomyelitidis TaxID=1521931 RepID=A0A4R2T1F1_9PAST|nr:RNA pyrophosphohydrolase [Cricetibacter osteomyelitidis]TCP95950.1 putative (di)nucleoside polyphosphate hydrolase [Cricetibacter osteomyelitidis]
MIDCDGYRPNVGIVICNRSGQVLWAKRYGQNSWQFPQGGINEHESPEQAMYRELYEEVGLEPEDVRILYSSKQWLKYKLPKRLLRYDSKPMCIGQKQRWFLLQLVSDERNINMQRSKTPEFDGWRWVSFWYPVRQVISFKRDVYRKALKEFSLLLFNAEKTFIPVNKKENKKTEIKKEKFSDAKKPNNTFRKSHKKRGYYKK